MSISRRTLLGSVLLFGGFGAARGEQVATEVRGELTQGGLVRGRAGADSRVTLDGTAIRVGGDGRFLLGFGRDAAARATLVVRDASGNRNVRELAIEQRSYDVQRIDGLPQNQVEPNEKDLKRIKADQARINAARARFTDQPFAFDDFAWPATGPISGVYGSQRILNGQPRRPHFGVDVAAPAGTPLKAPAGGVVSLADADLFFTGGTIMIDHGHGLSSIFAHMQKVAIKEGDKLAQGDVVGELGGTGRATGPHLHWGIYLFAVPLDPQLLVPPMPS